MPAPYATRAAARIVAGRDGKSPAFTLIELLTVVGIIAILLSLLVPGLEKALGTAEVVRCASNESAAGKALAMYLHDYRRAYPVLDNYNGLFGNLGNTTLMGSDHHGAFTRPLNPYLGYVGTKGAKVDSAVKVAQCPSDRGDPVLMTPVLGPGSGPIPSAYVALGVSYFPQMARNNYRTRHVFGWNGHGMSPLDDVTQEPLPSDYAASMRSSQIERADNKLILADWPWHGNRLYSNDQTRWHDPERRRFNALFADAHVEFFFFDPKWIEVNGSTDAGDNWTTPPNASFQWW